MYPLNFWKKMNLFKPIAATTVIFGSKLLENDPLIF
jgi:hypothetical protein